jgi:hypothetical protein
MKQTLNNEIRPVLRISEVEKLIKRHRVIIPAPSRRTLQRMCEEGTFESVGQKATKLGWLVDEDSFLQWIENLKDWHKKDGAK